MREKSFFFFFFFFFLMVCTVRVFVASVLWIWGFWRCEDDGGADVGDGSA